MHLKDLDYPPQDASNKYFMKNTIQKLVFIFILMAVFQTTFGQNNKIYFLADTINVSKENQILEIGTEGPARYYNFFCKCIPSYNRNAAFKYLFKNGDKIQSTKPDVNYISWKKLSELISKSGKDFSQQHDLIIIEVLPQNKYRVNPVDLIIAPPIKY